MMKEVSIRMVIDFNRCIRVFSGDEPFLRPSVPYFCTDCKREGNYSGKLVFKGEAIPQCETHGRGYRPVRPDLAGSQNGTKRGTMRAASLGVA